MKSVREMIDQAVEVSSIDRQITETKGICFLTIWIQKPGQDHFLFVWWIHGDETSWPLGIMSFIEQYTWAINDCMITLIPFANEYGYMHGVRFDALWTDLNRVWNEVETPSFPLVEAVNAYISDHRPTFVITLHEDDEQKEHYAYTFLKHEHKSLFAIVWSDFAQKYPVFSWEKLYWLVTKKSCIEEVVNDWSLEAVLHSSYGISTINLELSDSLPLEENREAVQVFLTSLVDAFCAKRNIDSNR